MLCIYIIYIYIYIYIYILIGRLFFCVNKTLYQKDTLFFENTLQPFVGLLLCKHVNIEDVLCVYI